MKGEKRIPSYLLPIGEGMEGASFLHQYHSAVGGEGNGQGVVVCEVRLQLLATQRIYKYGLRLFI